MLELFRTLSLRYLRRRWDRAGLIALSIALGVATLTSTRLINQFIETAAEQQTTPAGGLAELLVHNNDTGVSVNLAPKICEVPGVRAALPLLIERVVLPELGDRIGTLFGVDIDAIRKLSTENPADQGRDLGIQFETTNLLAALSDRAVAIRRELANDRDAVSGQKKSTLRVRVPTGEIDLVQFGLIDVAASSPADMLGPNLLVMEANRASKLIGRPGLVSRIDVLLAPGSDRAAVKQQIQAAIGDAALVQTPEDQAASTREVVDGVKLGFTLAGVGALVIGLFLVYNALSVGVTERRPEIGILRSLGATRSQVARLFAVEAILLGLLGSVVGIPMGLGLSHIATNLLADDVRDALFSGDVTKTLRLGWDTVLVALAGGVSVALIAALVPAVSAASEPPITVVRRTNGSSRRGLWIQAGISAGLVGLGVGLILYRSWLPHRVGSFGGMVAGLVGLLLSMPVWVALFSRAFSPIARRILGVEWRLAADNLLRSPGRTGVVIGALAAGVALMVQVAGVGLSNERPILDWLDRAVTADLFVFNSSLAVANASSLPLPADTGEKLRAANPEVAATLGVRYRKAEYRNFLIFVTALDAQVYYNRNRERTNLPNIALFDQLARTPGGVLISDNFAALHRVGVGDIVPLRGPQGTVELRILGIIQDYSWSRGTIFLDRKYYAETFDDPFVDVFSVFLSSGVDRTEAQAKITKYAQPRSLGVQSLSGLRNEVRGFLDRVYKLAYLQQFVVAVVATLGVVTALLISVLQRRRELGLLRAVGATQRQILTTVVAEAALMGGLGSVLGVIAGVMLEWYIVQVVIFEESGFWFELAIPWYSAAVIGLGSIILATLAGLMPALHAVQQNIAEAVAYE